MMLKPLSTMFFLASLFVLAGCTGSSNSTGTASGKVTYNGEAVTEGIVLFAPKSEQGLPVQAQIQFDGSYRIYTPDGGLPVGDYQVAITPPMIMTPDTADSPGGEVLKNVDNIPPRYRSPQTSDLNITIIPGSQTFDIAMTE